MRLRIIRTPPQISGGATGGASEVTRRAGLALQGWPLLTGMLQHDSRCRRGEQTHDSCEPPSSVGLSFHDPHPLAIENRHFVALCALARKISPLECPVSRDL